MGPLSSRRPSAVVPRRLFTRVACLALALAVQPVSAGEWSGQLSGEYRWFTEDPLDPRQPGDNGSLSARAEYYHRWDGGRQSLVFTPFFRWDEHDGERTHGDIRELIWTRTGDDAEVRAGLGRVFWGVTESVHLVDVVNQTDRVEDLDGEEKLGQPMLTLSLFREWGTLDLFMLPGFRERTFPGPEGRLRSIPPTRADAARYESGAEEWHLDWAARWSHAFGPWDLGLSQFYGTSRDPERLPAVDNDGNPYLVPYYPIISQTGIDVQRTGDNWLWKFELISRDGWGEGRLTAAAAGFEYTRYGVLGSRSDVGLLAEYLYNDREGVPVNPFEDDLFLGLRVTWNDAASTQLLAGVVADLDTPARYFSLEFSRRLGERWTLALVARVMDGIPEDDFLYSVSRDDYLQLELTRYF